MKNNGFLLLKTLLLSTSQRNIYRHTKDKKKKKKIVGAAVGAVLLYLMLMAYCIAMCCGYGAYGIIHAAPVLCALVISLIAFVFTVFKTNGYLFNFREYDMLMSLPFEAKTVAASKFLYMYVKSMPWYLSISLAMMIGYGIYAHPAVPVYPLWLVLTFFLPVIPMLFASFLGFLIARISAGFRKTNIIQTVLTMIFVIFCFSLRFIIEGLFRDNKVQQTLEQTAKITGNAAGIYLPAAWFSNAVTRGSIPDILLLVGVSALLFAALFALVGRSYRSINSALRSHAAARNYRMTAQKKRSVLSAIAFKEFKRLTGSTAYMTNAALGEILALLVSVLMLIIGFDRIIALVTHDAPIDASMLQPAIPFIIYFFIGMMATTVCSPSLEGKNYWIVQSLPLEKKTLYQGKMLFHMLLSVPFMLLSTLCMCVAARTPALNTLLYMILGFALCAFSTAWGCVCGVRYMRLDWENEIEVLKQGTGVSLYLLPNMFATMGLTVLMVFLGTRMDHRVLTLIMTAIVLALAGLSYLRVMSLAKRG
jgi:ABC-2 type transport system permease protein